VPKIKAKTGAKAEVQGYGRRDDPCRVALIGFGTVGRGDHKGPAAPAHDRERRHAKEQRGKSRPRAPGFAVGAVTVGIAILAPTQALFVPFFFVSVIALYLYSGPFTAISQNVVPPSLRASATTLTLFTAHLLGDSWSPAAVGWLSEHLHSLQTALLVTSTPLLLIAAAITYAAFKSVARDTAAMEETWAAGKVEALPA